MTLLLALEVSEKTGSVALYEQTRLVAVEELPPEQRSARSLIPGIQALFDAVGRRPADTGVVAVTVGPGSFTGLRIGVTTAKIFAYATSARILGVDTLSVLAAGVDFDKTAPRTVSAAVDAQRGEVVAQTFALEGDGLAASDDGTPQALDEAKLMSVSEWVAQANARGAALVSPILHRSRITLPPETRVLDAKYWHPRASVVGRLALARLRHGEQDDLWTLAPIYSRLAAAEEKAAGKQQ